MINFIIKYVYKKKIFLIIITLLFIIAIFISYDLRKKIINRYNYHAQEYIKYLISMIFDSENIRLKISNDYNVEFLPSTHLVDLEFKKIYLDFLDNSNRSYLSYVTNYKKTFYLEEFNDLLLVIDLKGKVYQKSIEKIFDEKEIFKQIKTNLDSIDVLDIYSNNKNIYISASKRENDCSILYLYKGEIDLEGLHFVSIFRTKECVQTIQSGKIQTAVIDDNSYILLATSADQALQEDQNSMSRAQDNNSLFGKIILINENDKSHKIISKGHRNILGLYSENEVILATDNGPQGGDEINKIKFNKNYGWPIASYGQKYYSKNLKLDYAKNHKDYNFEEPIFCFIPSIGISEIIKIENDFSDLWYDNFLIASLNSKHLYRVKFDYNFNKLLYIEKIFINERIRDLKYIKNKKLILMALENTGSIGILFKK